jgi:hypothetical protein
MLNNEIKKILFFKIPQSNKILIKRIRIKFYTKTKLKKDEIIYEK